MLLSLFFLFVQDAKPANHDNYNQKKGLALQGYDPVAYFDGQALKGQKDLSFDHAGLTYWFSSQQNLDRFKAEPEHFEPQYGGWCAYAMLEGDKVEIDPKKFKVVDGKLYLFYNGLWGDTLKKWNEMLAKTPENELIQKANGAWAKINP
ncbi:MAG: YHS domain-containing protein [Acidobacteria bacterium]|nr:YHS domain-containing protein [Acidobacteriota bacterium]MCB9398473.1 YHS domain-containing protein [Acidobacteriota bacterium]